MKSRIRTIKPEFFDDPITGTLEPITRLLFVGLLTLADRRGRLRDEPARIQVRILPYDRVKIEILLDDLVVAGLITRYYTPDSEEIIWIKNFEKHQMINHREPESTLPAYSEGISMIRLGTPRHAQARTGTPMGKGREGKGTEGKGREGSTDHLAVIDAGFDRFWSVYPNKKAKAAARRAWAKHAPDGPLVDAIVAAVETQKTWRPWREGYVPHPTTWLNQERWNDEPEPPRAVPVTVRPSDDELLAQVREDEARRKRR